MATDRVVTIKPGGTHTSLSGAEAAEAGDISAGTGSDERVIFELETFSGGLDDSAAFNGGWTLDNANGNYIIVRAAAGHEPDFSALKSGFYFANAFAGTTIRPVTAANAIVFEDLEFDQSSSTGVNGAVSDENGGLGTRWEMTRCIVSDNAGDALDTIGASHATFTNILIVDSADDGILSAGTLNHVTVVRAGNRGIVTTTGSTTTECFSYGCTTADWSNQGGTNDYNASGDSSAPGSTTYTSRTTADFANYAGGDYRTDSASALATGGASSDYIGCALEAGSALSASGTGVTVTVSASAGSATKESAKSATGTGVTVTVSAGTGTVSKPIAATGTGVTVTVSAGTGTAEKPIAATGTGVTVTVLPGTGSAVVEAGAIAADGTGVTVTATAGAGSAALGTPIAATGTGVTVTVSAGTGSAEITIAVNFTAGPYLYYTHYRNNVRKGAHDTVRSHEATLTDYRFIQGRRAKNHHAVFGVFGPWMTWSFLGGVADVDIKGDVSRGTHVVGVTGTTVDGYRVSRPSIYSIHYRNAPYSSTHDEVRYHAPDPMAEYRLRANRRGKVQHSIFGSFAPWRHFEFVGGVILAEVKDEKGVGSNA